MNAAAFVLEMSSLDWMTAGLLLFIFGGLLFALVLYLRTAYKSGGWKRVRRDLIVLVLALAAWAAKAIIGNFEMGEIPEKIKHLFH